MINTHYVAMRRLNVISIRSIAGLLAVVAASALGSWLLMADDDPAGAGPGPAHAVWNRHGSLGELMRSSTAVVKANVVGVQAAPPITPAQANAPLDTPSLPRESVTLQTGEHLFGDQPGDTFSLLRVLPPKGSTLTEDPPYKPGEEYLLFLRPGDLPGTWQVVGLDGRLPATGADFKGLLPNGPSDEINRGRSDLKRAIKEAKER